MSKEKKLKPSIKEVSRLAGVSIATVSRVIHNNGRFSEETAQRVLKVMKELNYTPDIIAQGMRTRTFPVIGIIVPDILDDRYGLMVRTVQERLFTKGYSAVIFNSGENGEMSQRFIDSLSSQHACGLIYIEDSQSPAQKMHDLPTVYFERVPSVEPKSDACTLIRMNDFEASRAAMKGLIGRGAKNVLLLTSTEDISSYVRRGEGAKAALDQAGVAYKELKLEPQRTKATIEAVSEMLTGDCLYDAVFSVSIRMTIGVLKVLHDTSETRKKITVLGIGVHRLHEYGLLDYQAVEEPLDDMARVAADAIVDLVNGEDVKREFVYECSIPI